jgi:uncharacterized protein (DUF849 family)
MAPYQVMVAPNGARRQKNDHPALPLTEAELARVAQRCQAAGATALHLHVRDDQGRHSLDAGRYRGALAAVAETAPGMAVQITTESAGIYTPDDQFACLQSLCPSAASISIREMAQAPEVAARVYAHCAEAGTEVQHILYGPGCLAQLEIWYDTGVVAATMRDAIFVLGQYVPSVLARPDAVTGVAVDAAALNLSWSLCAFGRAEQACLLAAIAAGGNVRVGFENNIETPDGRVLADNAASIAALIKAASAAGHTLQRSPA